MSKGSVVVLLVALMGAFITGCPKKDSASEKDKAAKVGDEKGAKDGIERFKVPVSGKEPFKGEKDALVTIVEFSDYECPFCQRVEPTIDQLMKDYAGKIKVVWKNNPLPFHKNAMGAHQAAMEAFAQGGNDKFWAMHKKLFENRKALSRADLENYAKELGLDVEKFKKALDENVHQAGIKREQQLTQRMGARGTPAFFINGRKLVGAQPLPQFKTVVDEEIKNAEKLISAGTSKGKVYEELTKNGLTKAPPRKNPNQRPRPDPNAVYKVPVSKDEPSKGGENALVTIVEFSDFECPFCKRVEPTVTDILKKYGDDVRVVWKNNPLPFHKNAKPAAIAAHEAFVQKGDKGFWAMHKLLFENNRALTRADLEKYGKQAGLNVKKLKASLDGNAYSDLIDKQQKLARSLGATGTPAFFINGRNLRGAQPLAAFTKVIDEELAKAKALVKKGVAKSKIYEETIKNGATSPKTIDPPKGAQAAAPDANKEYKIDVPKDAPRKGAKNAKVIIQEFSDFECPFCSRVNPTIEQVMKEYGDKVQIVWRHYPLPFHKNAKLAHMASIEVFKQGGDKKFWQYHDVLFKNRSALTQADLEKYAKELGGIDMGKFKKALETKAHAAVIQADMDAVRKAGARIGTPSFFINGKLIQGAQPFASFKSAIDAALK